jgi:hypothetical protein
MLFTVSADKRDERTDGYYEQFRPYELTVLLDTLSFNMLHTEKDFMPNFTTDPSPFKPRCRPDKRREPQIGKVPFPNPNLSGQASTSSASSSPSESGSEEDELDFPFNVASSDCESLPSVEGVASRTFESLLSDDKERYGEIYKHPKQQDIQLFEKYVDFGISAGQFQAATETSVSKRTNFLKPFKTSHKSEDYSSYHFNSFKNISNISQNVYEEYLNRGKNGPKKPTSEQMAVYEKYLSFPK